MVDDPSWICDRVQAGGRHLATAMPPRQAEPLNSICLKSGLLKVTNDLLNNRRFWYSRH
jgi:hypothetical protein